MKRGHVTGHKKERKNSNRWYEAIALETIARIDAEWKAKEQEQERKDDALVGRV